MNIYWNSCEAHLHDFFNWKINIWPCVNPFKSHLNEKSSGVNIYRWIFCILIISMNVSILRTWMSTKIDFKIIKQTNTYYDVVIFLICIYACLKNLTFINQSLYSCFPLFLKFWHGNIQRICFAKYFTCLML